MVLSSCCLIYLSAFSSSVRHVRDTLCYFDIFMLHSASVSCDVSWLSMSEAALRHSPPLIFLMFVFFGRNVNSCAEIARTAIQDRVAGFKQDVCFSSVQSPHSMRAYLCSPHTVSPDNIETPRSCIPASSCGEHLYSQPHASAPSTTTLAHPDLQ